MNFQLRSRLLAAALLTLSMGAHLHAAENPPKSLTLGLDGIPAQVRSHNPSLAAARYRIAEARGRLNGSGRLTNPELTTGYHDNTESSENSFEISLSQSFPLTDRLRLEKQVSRAHLAVAENEILDVERRLIAEALHDAIEYIGKRDAIALRHRQEKIATDLADFIDASVKRGEGSALDAGQSRLEATQVELEIHHLSHDTEALLGELRILLGLTPSTELKITGALPPPQLPSVHPIDPSSRPDYQALLLAIKKAEREVALAHANRVEDVKVGVVGEFSREEDAPGGLEDESIIGIRVTIPLPLWNRNEGKIEEKEAARQRAQGEAAALENRITNEIATALDRMGDHIAILADIDNKLLPLARKQVELTDTAYRNGQSDLQTVLRARDQEVKLESERLDALREFHFARADYEAAKGMPNEVPQR